jgi:carboxypeptidase family protein
MKAKSIGCTLFCLVSLTWGHRAWAQVKSTGAVLGTVTDATGAVVPEATVTLKNPQTGAAMSAVTGSTGDYNFPVVPVGDYELTVGKSGFKTFLQGPFSVSSLENVRLNAVLTVGQVSEQVTVTAAPPAVNTVTASEGDTVTGTQVNDLPLDTRVFTQLVLLEPGVASSLIQTPGFGSNAAIGFSLNGVRGDENNLLVDGVRNLDTFGGNAFVTPNLYSISEFRIENNSYSAATGRDAGAQVNLISRSGTNSFHGNAFEYFRNDALNARNFFSPTVPKNRYNDFGYDVGGPIKKDKYFFFWSEEWRRIIQTSGTYLATVATPDQRNGIFQGFALTNPPGFTTASGAPCITVTGPQSNPTSTIDPSCIDANASLLLQNYYPLPTPGFQQGPFNFVSSEPDSTHWREESIRLDANFSSKLTAYARFTQDNVTLNNPYGLFSTNVLPNVGASTQFFPIYNYSAHVTYVPRPNLTSEFGWGLYWATDKKLVNGPLSCRCRVPNLNIPELFPLNELDRIPTLSLGQGYAGINEQWFFHNYALSMPITNDNVWVRGEHTVKFGVTITPEGKSELANPSSNNTNGTFAFYGQVTGNALADFVIGRAFSYTETALDFFGNYRWYDIEPYIEDQIKLRPNLTLTVGVRYEYYSPEHELRNMFGSFDPALFDPSKAPTVESSGVITSPAGTYDPLNGIIVAGKNSPWGDHLFPSHPDALAPRVGVAWDPTSTGKMSVRAGYGVFYDRWGSYTQFGGFNPPFNSSVDIFNTFLSNPAGTASSSSPNFPPGLDAALAPWKYPQFQKWSISAQRQLPSDTVIEAAYVGTKGTHLLGPINLNQPFPNADVAQGNLSADAVRPYLGWSSITAWETNFNSSYNALQISAIHRLQHGLAFQAAYTWSKTLTDGSSAWGTPQDSRNIKAEKALASFDTPAVLVFNYVWQVPFFQNKTGAAKQALDGWTIAGITTFQKGFPETVTLPTDNEGIGGGLERPNRVGSVSGPRTLTNWFNTAAFVVPPIATFGNSPNSVFRGPGENNWDFGVYKSFRLRESLKLQFRAQFFNIFNHPSFNYVDAGLGDLAFGEVTSALNPRTTQFSLEVAF